MAPNDTVTMRPASGARLAEIHTTLGREAIAQLTLFKWRYALESQGFTSAEATRLLFEKWRTARAGITD